VKDYEREYEEEVEEDFQGLEEEEEISEYAIKGETPTESNPAVLLSITYDGETGRALLKLYDPIADKVYFWYDNTGHKPYLLTKYLPHEIVEKFPSVVRHKGFSHMELVEKYDPLEMRNVLMTKIYAKDPLSIGGRGSIRDLLGKTWESKIKYHHCYLFDRDLIPGLWYRITGGRIARVPVAVSEEVRRMVYKAVEESLDPSYLEDHWIPILQSPVPNIKRLAIDIEVYTPQENKVPRPENPIYEIISIALVSNDGLRRVLLLKRGGVEYGDLNELGFEVMLFDSEYEMLLELFKVMVQYPIIVTFNGDNFDLPYLYNRALKLGFRKEEVPILLRRDYASVPCGIHIDLYKFFNIKAIEVYAFGGKYKGDKSLDSIANALVGVGKIERRKLVSSMSLRDLAEYNYRDAFITLYLTTFNNDLVMRLIFLLSRIAKMPPEDLVRSQVSAWIRNLLYYEHRRRNWVIPNKEDIIESRGKEAYTKAIVKGKKYLGAIVMDPMPGIFTNVKVLDFASLYPSVIKRWNLSYEVVNCRSGCERVETPIPNLPHKICTSRRGLTSLIVGLLRDLRVNVYKRLSKVVDNPQERVLYEVVQSAMKVFINASYGVFGAETFPLYCPPVAELVTALARYVFSRAIAIALELGLLPIYGDTDSLFIWDPPEDKLREFMRRISEELNVDIELDKEYAVVAFSERKKNYFGVLPNGLVDVKGMVGKKRNTPEFVKDLFKKALEIISSARTLEEIEEASAKIVDLVRDYEYKLRNKQLTLDKLAIKVSLNKDLRSYTKNKPQHVKAAEQLLKYGVVVGKGDVVSFVKTTDGVGVKPVQLAVIDEVDIKKYIEYLETTMDQILDALGIDLELIRGVKRLEDYN